jgi:CHAT domain-containing protein
MARLSERSQAAVTLHFDPPVLNAVLLFDGRAGGDRLSLPAPVLEAIDDYARNLQLDSFDPFKHDFSVYYEIAASDLLPAKLLDAALKARSLILIPHGQLHLLPWAGLMHGQRRLFEEIPVGLSPNLGLLAMSSELSAPRQAAVVGIQNYPGMKHLEDLPSAQAEMEDVGSIYGRAGVAVQGPLVDEEATEAAFWKLAEGLDGDCNVLHMSCHGTSVPLEPMSSGLLLFDAKIDAAEIARARLPYNEVVLSACSTGWRPVKVDDVVLEADEILGIPAGFLESGVETVLVSIPKAEGQAARALTTHYHKRRAAGDAPLCAFKAAQDQLLKAGLAPGTWIGFALYGCI